MPFLDKLFRRQPTQDQFAKLFIDAARRHGCPDDIGYRTDKFQLLFEDGTHFELLNAYRDYCNADRAQKPALLRIHIKALASARQSAPAQADGRSQLRPVIRCRSAIESARMQLILSHGSDADFHPVFKPFDEDFVVMLALEQPESITTLFQGVPQDWGFTFEESLAISIDNLRHSPPDFTPLSPGVYGGAWKDSYHTSRALLPDLLKRAQIRGQPIFMVPVRETLLITGDADIEGLTNIVLLSHIALEHGTALSPHMYRYCDAKVERYLPENDETASLLATLARRMAKEEYDTQKEALDRIHTAQNLDIFVADYLFRGANNPSGGSLSLTSWTRGADCLLPKTDRLALVRPGATDTMGEVRVVDWAQASTLLGPMLERQDTYPVRYRTRGFPSDSQLAQLTNLPL
ncbi:hypothetical protein [Achromobacter sp. DH1f]|uniref:hypothetical protein n=1 Tax=Achromobacter sp. DH1f TaxID=1397275 RepID=UPI000468FBA2|nr:hypothetical protein [Achromobacter sp. DH1f]